MPFVVYEARLVFDEEFYEKIIKEDYKLLTKLMYINACSKGYKRMSNIMSKKIFLKILMNNITMSRELLRSSFYDIMMEELEDIEDEVERTIKYAIHITSEPPYRAIILTSASMVEKYEENPHFKGIKEINVKGGEDAIELVNSYWKLCTER
jgi:hypothetical protein